MKEQTGKERTKKRVLACGKLEEVEQEEETLFRGGPSQGKVTQETGDPVEGKLGRTAAALSMSSVAFLPVRSYHLESRRSVWEHLEREG